MGGQEGDLSSGHPGVSTYSSEDCAHISVFTCPWVVGWQGAGELENNSPCPGLLITFLDCACYLQAQGLTPKAI